MKKLVVSNMGLLAWLIAAPAIGLDLPSHPGVNPASQSAAENLSPATFLAVSHPAVGDVLAGVPERERALGLSAQLDELDYEELAVWEQIIPALSVRALAPDAREQESARRLGILPLLAARQKEYRAIELELGLALLASSDPSEVAVGSQIARLASIREWSDLVDQAQRQTRTALDTVHAVALARAAKAGARMDAAVLAALGRVRERRRRLEAARAEATAAWETGRDAARLEQLPQALGIAAALAQAAVNAESISEDLRKRAAEVSLPTSLRDLLWAAADVLQSTARVGGRSAAEMVEIVAWQSESFLGEPRKVDAADTALTPLLAERRRLATALRTSLAARVTALTELKSLAQQRDRILADAGYLAPTEGQRRAYFTVQQAAANAWRRVDELRVAAGSIASAEAGERALAAELLAVRLEELVLLESQLNTLAIGQLLDLTPRPVDPRLAGSASAWKRDVDALQGIDGHLTAWRKVWDEHGQREEGDLAALRALVVRTNSLWSARVALLARALPQAAANDEISRLTIGIVQSADARTQALAGAESDLRRLRDEGEADPVVGAVWKTAGAFRWSQASAGLRDLPRLFDQVARLRAGGDVVAVALNAALPSTPRLAAVMWLSEALDMPWLALGSGQDLRVVTELAGETYQLEGLAQNAPQLRRQREYLVDAPMRFMTVSLTDLKLAQAGAPSGQPHPIELDAATRSVLRVVAQVYTELEQNARVYALMPVAGAVVGGCVGFCAGPAGIAAGAAAGLKFGGAAVVAAASQDAIAGGYKVAIKGATAEIRRALPADYTRSRNFLARSQQYTERGVDIGQAFAAVFSSAARYVTGGGTVKLQRLQGLQREIPDTRLTLREIRTQVSALEARLRGPLSVDAQRDLTRTLARVREAENEVTKIHRTALAEQALLLSQGVKQGSRSRLLSEAAAESLADSNDISFGEVGTQLGTADASGRAEEVRGYLEKVLTSLLQTVTASIARPVDNNQTATDPEGERARQGYSAAEQQRGSGQPPRSAATVTVQGDRPSSDKLLESMDNLQREMVAQWEDKKERERLRLIQEKEQEKKDKEKKDRDATTSQDEIKKPVKPETPAVETEPSGPERKYWYGFDAVISYKFKGASCTQTVSGEVFGTRDDAEQALRDETAKAMRADAGKRSDVVPVRQEIYAGPSTIRPTYPGPSGVKAVQCGSVTTVTPQIRQWYVLEAVITFTTNAQVIGKTNAISVWGWKKMDCTATSWSALQLLPSELPEALRIEGEQLAKPRAIYPSGARVVSTRVYQGPSATQLKTPAYKQECGKPY